MEQANDYLMRYQQALTIEEKKAVVADYQLFLQTLTESERDQAREIMQILWPSIKQRVNELEPMMQKLDSMVSQLASRRVQEKIH